MSEKTEQPTPQRLQKARDDGDGGVSGVASQAVAFLVSVALLPAAVTALAIGASSLALGAIARIGEPWRPPSSVVRDAGLLVLALSSPVLGAAAIGAALSSTLQAGGVFSAKKLAPDVARLDPVSGLVRLLSLDRVFAVFRAAIVATTVAWLAVRALRDLVPAVALAGGDLMRVRLLTVEVVRGLTVRVAFVGVAAGVVDLLVTRRSWTYRLRMTKEEVKREQKDSEGDPHVKGARERAREDVLASATLAKVKEATVVIVNPTHLACALRYDETEGDAAPLVLATGRGDLAARIVEAARAYGIPVLRDVPLARALVELMPGDVIPEVLYEAVAEILQAAAEDA